MLFYTVRLHIQTPTLTLNFLIRRNLSDDKLTQYAVDIDNVVKTAVAEYSINPSEIENNNPSMVKAFVDKWYSYSAKLIFNERVIPPKNQGSFK